MYYINQIIKMKKTEIQKEQNRNWNNKNTAKIQLTNKKNYWKNKGFDRKYIDELVEKNGEKIAFEMLKIKQKIIKDTNKNETTERENRIKDISKLENRLKLLKSLV